MDGQGARERLELIVHVGTFGNAVGLMVLACLCDGLVSVGVGVLAIGFGLRAVIGYANQWWRLRHNP